MTIELLVRSLYQRFDRLVPSELIFTVSTVQSKNECVKESTERSLLWEMGNCQGRDYYFGGLTCKNNLSGFNFAIIIRLMFPFNGFGTNFLKVFAAAVEFKTDQFSLNYEYDCNVTD